MEETSSTAKAAFTHSQSSHASTLGPAPPSKPSNLSRQHCLDLQEALEKSKQQHNSPKFYSTPRGGARTARLISKFTPHFVDENGHSIGSLTGHVTVGPRAREMADISRGAVEMTAFPLHDESLRVPKVPEPPRSTNSTPGPWREAKRESSTATRDSRPISATPRRCNTEAINASLRMNSEYYRKAHQQEEVRLQTLTQASAEEESARKDEIRRRKRTWEEQHSMKMKAFECAKDFSRRFIQKTRHQVDEYLKEEKLRESEEVATRRFHVRLKQRWRHDVLHNQYLSYMKRKM